MLDGTGRVVADHGLVAQIVDRLGLDPPSGWSDLGGSFSTNLRIGDQVIRVHRPGTPVDRIRAEQAARQVLADAGLPTVPVRRDQHGSTVIEIDGCAVELEPYVAWTDRMNTDPLLEQGFGLLAQVHDVLATADLPAAAQTAPFANHIAATDAAPATRRGAARLRASGDPALMIFADQAERHVDRVAEAEAAYVSSQMVQICHGDFWDNNVLFGPSTNGLGPEVKALLDFGFMGTRPRVDDLALTIWFWLLEPGAGPPDLTMITTVARWLRRYDANTSRPLSTEERASLPLAIARQPAWSVGGWVLALSESEAYRHARECVPEQPVADAVLAGLAQWQDGLTR